MGNHCRIIMYCECKTTPVNEPLQFAPFEGKQVLCKWRARAIIYRPFTANGTGTRNDLFDYVWSGLDWWVDDLFRRETVMFSLPRPRKTIRTVNSPIMGTGRLWNLSTIMNKSSWDTPWLRPVLLNVWVLHSPILTN